VQVLLSFVPNSTPRRYKARWQGHAVAVKELHCFTDSLSRKQLREFLRECDLMIRLRYHCQMMSHSKHLLISYRWNN
jgi:hypothetical protein